MGKYQKQKYFWNSLTENLAKRSLSTIPHKTIRTRGKLALLQTRNFKP